MRNCPHCSVEYKYTRQLPRYCSDGCRFWAKVGKQPGDGCWLWLGSKISGYGSFSVARRPWLAHRWIFTQVYFDPGKLDVRHKCDVRSCVRPDHLETGTHADNMRDMVERGRHVSHPGRRGLRINEQENAKRSELSTVTHIGDDDVVAMREAYAARSMNIGELAAKHGRDTCYIGLIIRGKVRPEAGGPIRKSRYGDEDRALAVTLHDDGVPYERIGKRIGCGTATAWRLVNA